MDLQKPSTSQLATLPALPGTGSVEAWAKQRGLIAEQWKSFLGPFPKEKAALKTQVLETEELPEFTRQHITYQIEDGVSTDAYLLTPKSPKPAAGFPAIVVFHPTVKTHARHMVGLDDAADSGRLHGVQQVQRGYVVLCPRCYIFDDGADMAGNVARLKVRHPDWTGMARMTYDAIRAADFLETIPAVDKTRIGCFGHSLGAKETLYAAAFDERYKVAVFSEGGIGIPMSNWEAIWYLGPRVKEPGFALEHHQLMALVAPRAFLILAGNSADNDKSWAYVQAASPVYTLLGVPKNVGWFNHGAGHAYPPEARRVAETFLDSFLKILDPQR